MRLGILGGTFDPPHVGHLRLARLAQVQLELDRVLFVPCAVQPLKGVPAAASPFHRAAMLALSIGARPGWAVDFRELERGGVSFTVDTLESLRREVRGCRPFLLLGADSLATLPQWHRSADIVAMADLAVMPRGRVQPGAVPAGAARVRWLRGRPVEASSTDLRARLASGRSVRGLIPAAVASYIETQGLYGAARARRGRSD